jgi:membrane protein DedA with SNARE-associated domain
MAGRRRAAAAAAAPPPLSHWRDGNAAVLPGFFGELQRIIGDYGYWAVALGILLEDFGLPTPGETLLITGAIVASAGALNIYVLLVLAWLGAVVGDNIGYVIGRTGGHRLMLRYGRRFGVTDARLKQVEKFFDRHGSWVVVFARFVLVLRQFNGIVAGTLEMHWLRFLILNAVGAALWVTFWGILSFWLGKGILIYVHELHMLAPLFVALVALAIVIGGAYLWWRHGRRPRP